MSSRRRCPRWDLVLGLLGRRRSWSVKHNCFLQFHSVQMVALATAYINSGDYDVSLRYNYETVDEKYNHERERKRETKEWIERRPMQLWLICSYCYLIVVWPFFSRGMEIYIYIFSTPEVQANCAFGAFTDGHWLWWWSVDRVFFFSEWMKKSHDGHDF